MWTNTQGGSRVAQPGLISVAPSALFLIRVNSYHLTPDIKLTINSTEKRFEPPQKIQKADEIPLTKEEKERGVILSSRSSVINNSVTLISW